MHVRALAVATLLSASVLGGCRHGPPYGPGGAPSSEALLETTAPQLDAIQVSSARVVLNRLARGDLGFIAQAPGRFNGGVTFKGVEMVALAFNEEGYGLRSQSDDFLPVGFYEGPPPADCVVEALLGVPFETSGLVSLVLGGAPTLPPPFEIETQKWSRKAGYEYLVLRNDKFFQELRFGWIDGGWRVVGGALWTNAGGSKGRNLWTVEHVDVHKVGDVYLPERTKVISPGKRRDNLVIIIYKERNLDPAFAKTSAGPGDGGDEGGDEGGDWGDGGWEDDDWENDGGATEAPPSDDDEAAPDPASDDAEPEATPPTTEHAAPAKTPSASTPTPAPARKVPEVFFLDGTGLPSRGDLCR